MRVQFEMLRQPDQLLATLRKDGWELEKMENGAVYATHPRVPDEAAARGRLGDLGLLTSSKLRIDFLLGSQAGRMEGARLAR
jgi:hypothetical protein